MAHFHVDPLLKLLCCAAVAYGLVASLVNTVVPDVYMDEIFHMPQAQAYCRGDFERWDPKITTLPGLYLASLPYLGALRLFRAAAGLPPTSLPTSVERQQPSPAETAREDADGGRRRFDESRPRALDPLEGKEDSDAGSLRGKDATRGLGANFGDSSISAILRDMSVSAIFRDASFSGVCSLTALRSVNLAASLLSLALFFHARRILHPGETPAGAAAVATLLGLYPLHFFFGFLYYTDVLAIVTLLATHTFVLRRRFLLGAMSGAVSILMRQTNVVWMAFSFAVGLRRFCCNAAPNKAAPGPGIGDLARYLWAHKLRACASFGPAVAVGAAFVAFVARNGGIVMGDKQAHQASLHATQVLYFAAYASVMSFPLHISKRHLARMLAPVAAKPLRCALLAAVTFVLILATIHRYTMEHPYLLADNRHLTFYLWKGVIRRHPHVRYWLAPVYLLGSWSFLTLLSGRDSTEPLRGIPLILYVGGTIVTLVPAPLLEFRYFTAPFMLAMLHLLPPVKSGPAGRGHPELEAGVPLVPNQGVITHVYPSHASPVEKCTAAASGIDKGHPPHCSGCSTYFPLWLYVLGLFYVAINGETLYLFLFRPFKWQHEDGIQRFMW